MAQKDNYTESMKKIISTNPQPQQAKKSFGLKNSSVQIESEAHQNIITNYEDIRATNLNFDSAQSSAN